jgi:hypothetical protein
VFARVKRVRADNLHHLLLHHHQQVFHHAPTSDPRTPKL